MNRPRASAIGIFLSLALASPAAAPASEASIAILQFFNSGEIARQGMLSELAKRDAKDPDKDRIEAWMRQHYDPHEVEHRLGEVLDHYLSSADLKAWSRFIASPAGIDSGKIVKAHLLDGTLEAELAKLPDKERDQAQSFFNSDTMNKTSIAINSPEAQQTSNDYGQTLGCKYFYETGPELFAKLKVNGRCSDPVQ